MRFLLYSLVAGVAIHSVQARDDCLLNGITSVSTVSTATSKKWISEILAAVNIAADQFETMADVAQSVVAAYGAGKSLNGVTQHTGASALINYANSLVDSSVSLACQTAVLDLAKKLYTLKVNKAIPVECMTTHAVTEALTNVANAKCLYAMADVLAEFVNATSTTASSAADLLGRTLSSPMCTRTQIEDLDVEFGIYRNLVSKVLFNTYMDAGFGDAVADLPCKDVFSSFINSLPSSGITASVRTVCGTVSGNALMYSAGCSTQTWGTSADSISTSLASMISSLGLTNAISLSEIPKTRCDENDTRVLTGYNLYDPVVRCANLGLSTTTNYEDCLATHWSSLEYILTDDTGRLSCASCLNTFADSVNGLPPTGGDATLCDTDSFDEDCQNNLHGRGILGKLRSCMGFDISSEKTTCTTAEFAELDGGLSSVISYIVAAKKGLADTTATNTAGWSASVMDSLGNFVNATKLGDVPCGVCSNALTAELAFMMQESADFTNACENEYSNACLSHSNVVAAMAAYKKCSGMTLETEAPFTCSAEQYNMLSKAGVHTTLYNAISNSNTTTAASILSSVLAKIAAVESANKVTIQCKNCYSDVVTGLFDLSDTAVALCKSMGTDCIKLPAVQQIVFKYSECSGNVLDFVTATEPTPSPSTPTPTPDSKSAGLSAPVATLILAVVGAMLAL